MSSGGTGIKGLVLAAGLGTRLRPITEENAKPSLPILGVPTFWFAAAHLASELQLRTLALNYSHAPETLLAAAKDRDLLSVTGIKFHLSDETSGVLGSSGALWKLAKWVDKDLLAVTNGDSIEMPSWNEMIHFHRKHRNGITMHLRPFRSKTETYTHIEANAQGKVTALKNKKKNGVMFTGSYLIEPWAIARLPAGASELRPSLLEPLLAEGRLGGYVEDQPWLDTGTPETFAEAQFELLELFPKLRDLVEVKMKELAPGCWVPKHWGQPRFRLEPPVVLYGERPPWEATKALAIGPRYVGLAPPTKKTDLKKFSEKLVWKDFSQALD